MAEKPNPQAIIMVACTAFVQELNGRYREHISDVCLARTLWQLLRAPALGPSSSVWRHARHNTYGDRLLAGDASACYLATCSYFEAVLEFGCGVPASGHAVAQRFQEFMATTIETHHQKGELP